MPTQVQRSASARRRLMDATKALIATGGAGNASVAQIGELAGMSRGAVNFHFGSKDELLLAVADEVAGRCEDQLARGLTEPGQQVDGNLRAVLRAHLDHLAVGGDDFRIFAMLSYEALGPTPHLRGRFALLTNRVRVRMIAVLGELRDQGIAPSTLDPEAFATAALGAFYGLGFLYLLDPDRVDLSRVLDELVDGAVARLTT